MKDKDLIFSNVVTIVEFIERDMKISAIKEIREQTGWGLKDAKDYLYQYYPSTNRYGRMRKYDPIETARQFHKDHLSNVGHIILKDEDMLI